MTYPTFYNKYYSLQIEQKSDFLYINMQIIAPIINTISLPSTYKLLCQMLPSIHLSRCFNNAHLPFYLEVKKTEIGHLFEHILLEYLYQIQSNAKTKNIVVIGETTWDWNIDPQGLFHIVVKTKNLSQYNWQIAIDKSKLLIDKIMESKPLLS